MSKHALTERDLREVPAYTIDEAARYLRLPKSTLRAWMLGQQRFRSVIEIADRGPGIPPSEVERLKQPFTRLDTARGSAAGGKLGSGLGLAIVDRVVTLHGGEFTLLLRQDGGTLARIVLPLPAMTGR